MRGMADYNLFLEICSSPRSLPENPDGSNLHETTNSETRTQHNHNVTRYIELWRRTSGSHITSFEQKLRTMFSEVGAEYTVEHDLGGAGRGGDYSGPTFAKLSKNAEILFSGWGWGWVLWTYVETN